MNQYIIYLLIGFGLFMCAASYSVYLVLKMAHDEDPGCLHPGKH